MKIDVAERLKTLPPYLFVEIDRLRREAIAEGKDILNFGIGDPDTGTPQPIIDALSEAVQDSDNHHYALDAGMPALKQSIADWYQRRFGVILATDTEVLPLIGSKEGIGHLPVAFINRGDVVLVPDPGYPVYQGSTLLCEGEPVYMPLLEKNGFLPDFSVLSENTLKRAKLMFLNYPNNPTAACATRAFFEEVVAFAKKYNIIVAHDAAYTEVAFDGYKPLSFMEVDGAKDVGVEFHSLSKTFNMTGWRVGVVVGNKDVIAALGKVKSNVDSGIFQALQLAGKKALDTASTLIPEVMSVYTGRRDALIAGLRAMGWDVTAPKATFYVWAALPAPYTSSMDFVKKLIREAAIITTPGIGFGPTGEGYIRFALTVDEDAITCALERLKALL